MALSKGTVAKRAADSEPGLDQAQTLRASKALLSKIQSDAVAQKSSGKPSLLDDADDEDAEDEIPVWLILTTKKHIIDKKRLKPGKVLLPHPYLNVGDANLRICLITADPQRRYKDIVADPSFPVEVSQRIQRVIDVKKLKAKYKPFEARRQLFGEYDVFLADDRVITLLPKILGKVFYKSGSKRPIPISLEGRRQNTDEQGNKRRKLSEGGTKVIKDEVKPATIAHDIERTLHSALVHLAPSTTTAVKVGIASMEAEHVQENIEAVVHDMVERYVPQKWRNLRAVHIKGPNTAALPIWLAEELWEDEQDVLEEATPAKESRKKRTRGALEAGDADEGVIEVPGADGKMRRVEKPPAKRKSSEVDGSKAKKAKGTSADENKATEALEVEKKDKAARKAALQKQKSEAKAAAVKAR
ncbi:ribosomal protein L1 [Dissoconium aciculare CBS 342.82]|uniref:Ribosomal protein L1 n=1 Tax=Dissoconium aciculare CBS 342.82 TaxID=1314786 RepID=A0A6J3M690_9PEZI|nr:ribosomal protein L1 [Dissoconium aciculare CBS 342.82]KAF1823525.1 ribosomal protein L1 [Dissoconium aciculare CBS 342.82]